MSIMKTVQINFSDSGTCRRYFCSRRQLLGNRLASSLQSSRCKHWEMDFFCNNFIETLLDRDEFFLQKRYWAPTWSTYRGTSGAARPRQCKTGPPKYCSSRWRCLRPGTSGFQNFKWLKNLGHNLSVKYGRPAIRNPSGPPHHAPRLRRKKCKILERWKYCNLCGGGCKEVQNSATCAEDRASQRGGNGVLQIGIRHRHPFLIWGQVMEPLYKHLFK